jgi:hypothetical protein
MPSISKTLFALTNGARICLDNIQYYTTEEIVKLSMQRKELVGFKKSFLGMLQPVYSQAMIDTTLTIREVVKMNIEYDDKLVTECNSCFTVLPGLNVDGNELYFGSIEEIQGKVLCQIFITIRGMNIEFADKEKSRE